MYTVADGHRRFIGGLFNHGILSLAVENNHKDYALARFTSGLIYRICIDCVHPTRYNAIAYRMLLLETAFRHMSPGQLGIKMSWNLRGPSEHVFQMELYSIYDIAKELALRERSARSGVDGKGGQQSME